MDYVKTKDIVVDESQPRKYFDAVKLKLLGDSIKREGIISPLIVEKVGDKFLLIDGERRYRAATQLKLEKVPAVIEAPRKGTERLIRQFTVQSQHEDWTAVEKAVALSRLADEMGMTLSATCNLLNISKTESDRYVAFANLADKKAWVASEVPLDYVTRVVSIKREAKRLSETELKKEFNRSDEKRLEHRILEDVKRGVIVGRAEITRLMDSFKKEPKNIEKYLSSTSATPTKLFLESGAQGAAALRNVMYNARYITMHTDRFLQTKDVKISEDQVKALKAAKRALESLIAVAE